MLFSSCPLLIHLGEIDRERERPTAPIPTFRLVLDRETVNREYRQTETKTGTKEQREREKERVSCLCVSCEVKGLRQRKKDETSHFSHLHLEWIIHFFEQLSTQLLW